MKDRQIKIYGFDRGSIAGGVIASEDLESKTIALPDCFFVQAYECYSGITTVDVDFITGIIKVVPPKDEEDAEIEFTEGLKLGDDTFKGWIATTAGMKAESNQRKCETIFIREDIYKFTQESLKSFHVNWLPWPLCTIIAHCPIFLWKVCEIRTPYFIWNIYFEVLV